MTKVIIWGDGSSRGINNWLHSSGLLGPKLTRFQAKQCFLQSQDENENYINMRFVLKHPEFCEFLVRIADEKASKDHSEYATTARVLFERFNLILQHIFPLVPKYEQAEPSSELQKVENGTT